VRSRRSGDNHEPTEARPTEPEEIARIDLANLFPKARDYGAQALVGFLRQEEERMVELLRSDHLPDGRPRFVRNGRYHRRLVTKLGGVILEVGRVYDRLRQRTFAPVLLALGLQRRRYTRDLRFACAEEASRTSYGGASESIQRSLGVVVPRRSIWNFVREIGPWMEQGTRAVPVREEDGAHLADGTFVRGLRRRSQHEVNVAVRQRSSDHVVEVVGIDVDRPAREVLGPTMVDRLVTDDALAYSAGAARWHSLCHVHFLRRVTALLTEERGLMTVSEREAVVKELTGILGHLRASVEAHRLDGNRVAVTNRVAATLTELGRIGTELERRGLHQTGRYVRERGRATVVFAEVTNRGGWMPATSNGVERVMGMVAERCKRKWAHWNGGLRNLLLMLLVRKTRPASYGWAMRGYLRGGSVAETSPSVGRPINNP
jgi:hypothetical protein